MDIELIRKFALKSDLYTEKIEFGYEIPKTLRRFDGRIIYLLNSRKEALRKNGSSFSRNFEKDMNTSITILKGNDSKCLEYVKEFPIIIEDRGLWNDILNNFQISDVDIINTNYFFLDYFFPYLGIIVEIDSNYHNIKGRGYDQARDLYIRITHGFQTLRFYEYGKDENAKRQYQKVFNKTMSSRVSMMRSWNMNILKPVFVDFSTAITNNFIEDNKDTLEFIDKVILFIGHWNFYKNQTITIKFSDLWRIDSYRFPKSSLGTSFSPISLEQLFLDNVTLLVLKLYGKDLRVTT